MKKVRKYLEYFITKIHVFFEQKIYKTNGISLKYILKRSSDSKDLIVVFSACTRKGIRARYNYVRTLKDINCNKLFILDDFAEDHRGGYYLGHESNFSEEIATKALCDKIIANIGVETLIFCGSSKGGYATLNIGSQFPNAYMIPGGPQYYLATYLINDGSFVTLKHIMEGQEPAKVKKVDLHLPGKIAKNPYHDSQKIFLHYSNKEHTYEEHIKDLIEDLVSYGYHVEHDICDYTNHSDISYYYPDYLVKTILKLI